jgi:hypothetical protein
MKNNINILKDIDSSVFLNKIKIYLGNNLSNQLITSLSNMLAIDYVNRLKQEPKMDEYAMECVDRLTTHLNHKVFTDEGFSIFEPMTSSVTNQNVVETFMQNAMSSDEFLNSDSAEKLQETLREDGFYVMYPPLGGGRRRTRRRRAKKPTKRRRRS